jgi:hypothetical protein
MISLFNLISVWGGVFGLAAGAALGGVFYGWRGLLLGALSGAYIGLVLGRLPRIIAQMIVRLARLIFCRHHLAAKDKTYNR